MAVNKVIYGNTTLVDLTSDTVTADNMAEGVRATGADGTKIVGLLPKVAIDNELSLTSTNPVQNKTITAALSNLDIDIATNDEIDNALNLAGSGDLPTGGGGIVPIALGGTGATTTAGARTNLGVSATTDFAKVAFSGSYNDLTGTPTIPTATGDLTNNSGYITSSALNGYVKSVNGTSPDSNGNVSISVSGSSGSGGGNYTLPTANSSTLGGVKIGSNISVSSGTISITKSNVTSALGYTPPVSDTTYVNATASAAGLMSSSDKSKLDSIAANANNYIHPASHPASMITGLAAVATSGSYSDLTDKPVIPGAYTLPNATSSTLGGVKIGNNISVTNGTISLSQTDVTSALGYTPPASDTTYGDATTTSSGLMSSTDKVKLNGIADNANYYIHPPTHPASMISGLATVATSGNYNDLANKPGDATTSSAGLMSAADKSKLDGISSDAGSVKMIVYS